VRVEDTPSSDKQLISREVLVEIRRKKIELMVTIGNIFHRSISLLVKRNQANIDTLPQVNISATPPTKAELS
jgi:hypothetical protein